MKKPIIISVVIAVLLAVGVAVAFLLRRKKVAVPPPIKIVDPFDPLNPLRVPVAGRAYVVKTGDTMIGIIGAAGFTSTKTHAAYLAMLNDTANKWIGVTDAWGALSLRFNRRFEPVPGKDFSYLGAYHDTASTALAWPVVRVPAFGEV